MFYVGITDLEKSMLNFTSRQKKTPVGWEEVLFTSKAVRFYIGLNSLMIILLMHNNLWPIHISISHKMHAHYATLLYVLHVSDLKSSHACFTFDQNRCSHS